MRKANTSWSVRHIAGLLLILACLAGVIGISASCRTVLRPVKDLPKTEPEPQYEETSNPGTESNLYQNIRFDHLSLEEGLSQSTITAILQDNQGFMWLGTLDGLNRYDGYSFKTFKHDPADPTSLRSNNISTLYEDATGNIWVGTDGGGLHRFDRDHEQFTNYRRDPDNPSSLSSDNIRAILEDDQGNFWIGTNNGLNQLDRTSGSARHLPNEIDPPTVTEGSNSITAIHQDEQGTLWIGTLGGLLSFEPETELYHLYTLNPIVPPRIPEGPGRAKVLTIHEDAQGILWIGSRGDGLFSLEPETGLVNQYLRDQTDPHSLHDNVINAIQEDGPGVLWVGTAAGLDRLDAETGRFKHYQHQPNDLSSLSDDNVRSITIDQAGVLWVGTTIGGINKFDPYKSKFQHIQASGEGLGSLSHPQVWTFYQDGLDYLWIGTSVGLNKIDRRTGLTIQYFHDPENPRSISNDFVTSVIADQKGDLWFATRDGLNRFNRSENRFIHYLPDPEDPYSLSNGQINLIHEDKDGNLWVGTAGSGLDRLDRDSNRFSHYQYQQEGQPIDILPINYITSIFEDKANILWVGTRGGLLRYNQEADSFSIFQHDPVKPDSLGHDFVNAIYRDRAGALWVATPGGLDRFDDETGTFDHYTEEDGLPNNMVLGILEDEFGNLWLSTNRGLSRFNIARESFRNFDTSDGLQSLEFNSGAYYKNRSGEMFFGGINGFNYFRPDEIHDNPYKPPIVITDLRLRNESVSFSPDSILTRAINTTEEIELNRQDSVLTLELAALHFSTPEEIQYAYILEGFDPDWNYIGSRRFATYTNLPPGNYTFRAIGTNSDGIWSDKALTLGIKIPYPFWQTWWFAALTTVGVITLVLGAFRLRTRNIAQRTRELERQVVSRTAEIERRRQIAEGLREILVLLNSNRSLEESLHYIVTQAARLTDAEDVIIFQCKPELPMAIVATNPGGQIRYTPGAGLVTLTENWAKKSLLEREPLIVPDLVVYWLANPEIRAGSFGSHKALLGLPVVVGNEIYGGLIMLYNDYRSFSEDDLELGSTFSDQATLAIANDQLRRQVQQTAVASERSRLARELHDAVTQTIFSASLIAETIPTIWESDQDEGIKLLHELRQLTRGALAEMRTLLLELRPAALEEASLPELLNQLAEAVVGRSGVPVNVVTQELGELPVNVKVALYRIAQEALNNVMKHARATQVEIRLGGCPEKSGVTLVVIDNGRGFEPENMPAGAGRHGLANMRERAQTIGAELLIQSQLNDGTQITITWQENGWATYEQ